MSDNIIAPEHYVIKPSDIDVSKLFLGAFDKVGREVLANTIVQLCQILNYWHSFSIEELRDACQITGANIHFLKDLVGMGDVVIDRPSGSYKLYRYCVTVQFVKKCHASSPKE